MKYMVIAIKWSSEEQKQVKYVAGEFDEFMNASIFRDAYNKFYSANAYIVERV